MKDKGGLDLMQGKMKRRKRRCQGLIPVFLFCNWVMPFNESNNTRERTIFGTGRASSPRIKIWTYPVEILSEASREVLGDQLGYMNLQFTRD